jgi:tRNA1(Val) A37 N6-methylase TrmN6
MLTENQRIDDLYWCGLKIIQDDQYFCMALDAVLLADFVKVRPRDKVVDLGTGNGAIPLLLWAKEHNASYTGLELMPKVLELAKANAELNDLQHKIVFRKGDIKKASFLLGKGSYSLVVSNPPYAQVGSGRVSESPEKAAARTEIHCSLEDVVREGAALLNSGGRLALVHRPTRLAEIMQLMFKYGITPKRLRLIYPLADKEPNIVLAEGQKYANLGLSVMPPLVVYKEKQVYTKEMLAIFQGRCLKSVIK